MESKVKICPKCKSLMTNGRCTNKACMATVVDIDHKSVEAGLLKDHKNIGKVKNLYANGMSLSQSNLYDKGSIIDKYGVLVVPGEWYKLAKEHNLELSCTYIMQDGDYPGRYMLLTLKEATYKEVAKNIKRLCKYYVVFKSINSRGQVLRATLGSNDGVNWDNVDKTCSTNCAKAYGTPLVIYEIVDSIMNTYNKWSITMQSKGSDVKITYFIHKDQAYEIFKNREIREGKKKRVALRHSVNKYTKEDETLVNAYIRCDPVFEWNDMQCQMNPPIKLLEELEQYKKGPVG